MAPAIPLNYSPNVNASKLGPQTPSPFASIAPAYSAVTGKAPANISAAPARPAVPITQTWNTAPPAAPIAPAVPTWGALSGVKAPAAPASSNSYTVGNGDTLSGIASKNGMSLAQLLALNPQFKTNPNLIRAGQSVMLGGNSSPAIPTVNLHPPITTPSGTVVNPSTGGVVNGPTVPSYVPTNGGASDGYTQTNPTGDVPPPSAPTVPQTIYDNPELTAAEKAYADSQKMTPEEIANQQSINNIDASLAIGSANTSNQAIPMDFITGQKKALEDRALALETPLTAKAALLQAQRTGAMNASKASLDAETAKLTAQASATSAQATAKADASKPVNVAPGGTLVDPTTGKTIFTAPNAPEKGVSLAAGDKLVDPTTGKVLAFNPKATGGAGGGSGNLSDGTSVTVAAQAVLNNPDALKTYSTKDQTAIQDSLLAAGVDPSKFLIADLNSAQRTQLSKFDNVSALVDTASNGVASSNTGPMSSYVQGGLAMTPFGNKGFIDYQTALKNLTLQVGALQSSRMLTPAGASLLKGMIPDINSDQATAADKLAEFQTELLKQKADYLKNATSSTSSIIKQQSSSPSVTKNNPGGI